MVAQIGMEHKLELPKLPQRKKRIYARTQKQRLAQLSAIAKKTVNLWLSKLRHKYRPSRKEDTKTKNVNKKPAVVTESSLEDSGSDYTDQEYTDGDSDGQD